MVAADLSLKEVRQTNYMADKETENVWQETEYGAEVGFGKRQEEYINKMKC